MDLENPRTLDHFEELYNDEFEDKTNFHHILSQYNTYLRDMRQAHKTSHILLPMGDDFSFQDAELNYMIIDKIIGGTRSLDSGINIFYSTVEKYLQSVQLEAAQSNINWSVHKKDFFPLIS